MSTRPSSYLQKRVDVLLRLIKATRKTTSSLQPPTDFRFIQSVALWHCTTKLRIGLEGDGAVPSRALCIAWPENPERRYNKSTQHCHSVMNTRARTARTHARTPGPKPPELAGSLSHPVETSTSSGPNTGKQAGSPKPQALGV
ncbi:hypothetical protein RRG08_060118 [Elysia crispata]|uniref:Uncharacterized protein n=1 Tax=Elysia crispata TaxID=231223 RepID=A0AAE1ED44_9GAST|nr:hypothetical protein RRG08_060118 [Elysia crispata]